MKTMNLFVLYAFGLSGFFALTGCGKGSESETERRIFATTYVQEHSSGEWLEAPAELTAFSPARSEVLAIPQATPAQGLLARVGSTLWDLVTDSEFMATLETQSAHILPSGVTDPLQLSGWK